MSWRLANSLATLRAEVNGFAPSRSKRSDGTIGDPAHAARASRHNPNRYRVVTALDLTHDLEGGFDAHGFARRHVLDPHPELAYIISNREIAKRRTGFTWERYRGSNGHTLHIHVAVGVGPDSDPLPPYDSTLLWGVSLPNHQEDDMPLSDADILRIAQACTVAQQEALNDLAADVKARIGEVQGNLADLERRVHGVPLMADGTEQHKADAETGRRFQELLGD